MTLPADLDDPAAIAAITAAVDISRPPPGDAPSALVLFGTNQPAPALMAAALHHRGLAPLIICTGGVNRHTGIVEGPWFRQVLLEHDVPDAAIRVEDASATTWENIRLARPFILEAMRAGLPVTAVSKWFHRRAVTALLVHVPELPSVYGLGWDPVYDGVAATRRTWATLADGRRRDLREYEETARRVAAGEIPATVRGANGWLRG